MLCPHCGAEAPAGARFCGRCGRDIGAQPTQLACPHCGQPVGPEETFCPHCGRPTLAGEQPVWEPPADPEAVIPTKQPRSGPAILAWVLVALALVVIAVSGILIVYAISPRVQQMVAGLLPWAPEPTLTSAPAEVEEPTSAPSPSVALSPTAGATATAQDVAPPTATTAPTVDPALLDSDYVADVTLPDGSGVAAGVSVVKTWRILNSGSVAWPAATHLRHVEGETFGVRSGASVGPVEPGQEVDLSLTLQAPREPGEYQGVWRLHADESTPFGARLIALVTVTAPSTTGTGTPSSSATATPTTSAQVTLIYEYGWTGGWMGVTNQGKWAYASDGRAYGAELGLLSTPTMRAALADMLPNGWRLKIMVRPEVTFEGWTLGCAEDVCQAHTSDAGQQLIINHVYLTDATWTSFLDDWLAGGSQRVIRNEHYAALQAAVFAPLDETPDGACLGFRFVEAD